MVTGEQLGDRRPESRAEEFRRQAGLREPGPGKPDPIRGAFELTHERRRLEENGTEGLYFESRRQHRVQPISQIGGGRLRELEVEDLGP